MYVCVCVCIWGTLTREGGENQNFERDTGPTNWEDICSWKFFLLAEREARFTEKAPFVSGDTVRNHLHLVRWSKNELNFAFEWDCKIFFGGGGGGGG